MPAVVGHELHADARMSWPGTPHAAAPPRWRQRRSSSASLLRSSAPTRCRCGCAASARQLRRRSWHSTLSAMWAGPLCARILHQAGWHVLKIEDSRRPDGARSGPAAFTAACTTASRPCGSIRTASGRAELGRLAQLAGVVVEDQPAAGAAQARPRRRGLASAAPGRVWVSVTGSAATTRSQRVAFGDDAAVAGGCVARAADGTPAFCGDAIADPVTGMTAGLAALAAAADGGGWLRTSRWPESATTSPARPGQSAVT